MLKIQRVEEIRNIRSPLLRDHIEQKVMELMTEYETETLDEIGCFIVLEQSEFQLFQMEEMEFSEVLVLGNETYLHGVRVVSDGYGEDVYLSIERVMKCQS